ncbi:flavodoxin/nitric oxide synthase [Intrasporangium calvum]|uniref:Flavodoxin/nitric oxide synthase n=1 Tax=Intrasporangium calvum TaxID=53358 RepID=A0ABT5GET2_9MICO|nr:flavodoxin/nitric oxide synthase [Intrasporangium calvum]MDC5696648.1 flavodoxin/nitric oxide synthase [Intrasporangium calvum]
MKALIIHESLFGNTKGVAEAIKRGLTRDKPDAASLVRSDEAPGVIPEEVSLLIVGGPTHAFSMTRESTRQDARTKGAKEHVRLGIREWVEAVVPRPELPVLTFDTRVKVRLMPGSAAKSAAKALRARGFRRAEQGETFWVADTDGPLNEGELERAEAWGEELGARADLRPGAPAGR